MNEQYIKQLEESNENLHNALGRERFMRDVEKRRRNRVYRVEILHIDNRQLHKAAEDLVIIPDKMGNEYGYTYSAMGITAARNIIRSHLFMRDQVDGGLLGAGITWVIQARERNEHYLYASGERPSVVTLSGWIVIGHKYPGWGGKRVSNRYFESRNNITEIFFDSYTEYGYWVMIQERMK